MSTPYGFRILGTVHEDRRLVTHAAAFVGYCSCDERAQVDREAYLSAFQFGADFAQRADQWGRLDVAGFVGPCCASWLWFDVDREDLDTALKDSRRLAATLDEHYRLGSDDLLTFFSGSKGFHVGLPLSACGSPAPAVTFHNTARRFAEHVAELAGVPIDTGVYDHVRAFRAPNSRHPKTGRHKRRLTLDELLGLSLGKILTLAADQAPFDVPNVTRTSDQAAADWKAAAELAASDHQAKAARQANGSPTLNRATLAFITGGAGQGDRHRLLFSAAANLAEFGCPLALAVGLLEEPALDSGLAPKDVRRQIECGLSAVLSPSSAAGDSAPATATPPSSARIGTADPAPVAAADPAPAAVDLRAALAKLWNGAQAVEPGPAHLAGSATPGPAPVAAADSAPATPPAADTVAAALARLWSSAQADGSAPGPQRHQGAKQAKGLPLAVGAEPPPLNAKSGPCSTHTDPTNWREGPAPDRPGWIRSTCRVCGAVVGHRPDGRKPGQGGTP